MRDIHKVEIERETYIITPNMYQAYSRNFIKVTPPVRMAKANQKDYYITARLIC